MTAEDASSASDDLSDLPDWVREGETVVALSMGASDVATDVVVTRITKTQIVCVRAGRESRYRRRDLRELGEHSAWRTTSLWPRDAPRIVALRTKEQRVSVAQAVEAHMQKWRQTGERGYAEDAAALLRSWLALHQNAERSAP
jgi:hypothetical protein